MEVPRSPRAHVQNSSVVLPPNVRADVVRAAFDYTKPVVRPDAYREFFAVNNTLTDSTKIQPMSAIAAEFGSDTSKRYAPTLDPSRIIAH